MLILYIGGHKLTNESSTDLNTEVIHFSWLMDRGNFAFWSLKPIFDPLTEYVLESIFLNIKSRVES